MKTKNYTSLVLTKKWFDMILAGKKKEEYREIKPSYANRFLEKDNNWTFTKSCVNDVLKGYDTPLVINYLRRTLKDAPKYIIFYHAYKTDRPMVKLELKSIRIAKGKKGWGAIKGQWYFVLELGEIIETNNI